MGLEPEKSYSFLGYIGLAWSERLQVFVVVYNPTLGMGFFDHQSYENRVGVWILRGFKKSGEGTRLFVA